MTLTVRLHACFILMSLPALINARQNDVIWKTKAHTIYNDGVVQGSMLPKF